MGLGSGLGLGIVLQHQREERVAVPLHRVHGGRVAAGRHVRREEERAHHAAQRVAHAPRVAARLPEAG